jgi:hypothetical protein
MEDMRLEHAMRNYLRERAASFAPNTVKNDKAALTRLMAVLGDVDIADIDRQSMIRVLSHVRETRNPSSTNAIHGTYSAFFRWCRAELIQIFRPAPTGKGRHQIVLTDPTKIH